MSVFSPVASHSAKFQNPGDIVEGQITEISEQFHANKYNSQEKDYWPSKDPVMNVRVTLQTQQRDPQDPQDQGKRALYVTVSGKEGGMLWAIRNALKEVGADDLTVGGYLAIRFAGTDPESQNPQNPRKLYQARYQPPAAAGGTFQAPPAQQQPQQQYQQPAPTQQFQQPQAAPQAAPQPAAVPQWAQPQTAPAQQPQAAPLAAAAPQPVPQAAPIPQAAPVPVDAQQIAALIAQGYTDPDIANATGATVDTVAIIRQSVPTQ